MKYTEIKITEVKAIKPYILRLKFNDQSIKTINLEPILYGDLYGALRNQVLFKKVRVNEEVMTIEWPNGADFHPETLYNWDEYKDELASRAQQWQRSKTA